MSKVISGGLVAFEDGVKAAEEYSPAKKARVELRFDVAEDGDADAALNETAKKAQALVYKLLGVKAKAVAIVEPTTAPPATPAAEPEAPKPRGRRAPAAVADGVTTKDDLAAAAGIPVETKPAGDDLSQFDVPAAKPAAETISDADLLSEIGKKNAVLQDPVKIRALVAEYSGGVTPFSVVQLPQDQRAGFIVKLKALK